MEQSDLILAVAISLVFSLAKFVEFKFILKEEDIDVKNIFRNTLLVCVSAIIGKFIIGQVDLSSVTKATTNAFTGVPDF